MGAQLYVRSQADITPLMSVSFQLGPYRVSKDTAAHSLAYVNQIFGSSVFNLYLKQSHMINLIYKGTVIFLS